MTTITIDREKAKQAMEMLDVSQALLEHSQHHPKILAAYEALRAALAAQPQTVDEAMELPRELAKAYENGWSAATAAERERCARVINSYPHWLGNQAKTEIAAKIRSGE